MGETARRLPWAILPRRRRPNHTTKDTQARLKVASAGCINAIKASSLGVPIRRGVDLALGQ
jgi:hypothetical protein